MPHHGVSLILIMLLGIIWSAPGTHAHKGAKGVVKQRMDGMKAMGAELKALGLIASGRAPYDGAKLKDAARVIKQQAAQLPKAFPKGSMQHPSQSLPVIWQRWAEFEALFRSLGDHAAALERARQHPQASATTMKPIIRQMTRNCSSCHKLFRRPKQ